MKVIFLPDGTSANPYQTLLAENLRRHGVQVEFDNFRKWPALSLALLRHRKTQIVHLHWLQPYLKYLFFTDLFFVSYPVLFMMVLDLLFCRLMGKHIVWTIHNTFAHETQNINMERLFRKALFSLSSQVYVHSQFAIDEAKREYGVESNKFVITPHGHYINSYPNEIARQEARQILGVASDQTVYLYFGNIREYKGVTDLIDEFKKTSGTKSATLIIAGNPRTEQDAEALLEQARDCPGIRCVFEYIEDIRIQTFMNAADICVFPFKEILTSGSVILAMSYSKAVIVPRKGALLELLDEHGALFVDDQLTLGEAMEKSQSMDLVKMGRHNHELIKQYSWENTGKILKQSYERILKG